jgi:hypothetical protein
MNPSTFCINKSSFRSNSLPLIVTLTAEDLLRNGPIVKIEIGNPSDPSRVARVNALVDTGAAFTAMNPRLAENCGLIQRGQKKIHVPGNTGPDDARVYPEFAASVHFPDSDLLSFRVHGIIACPIFETQFSCLIGRDILKY